MVNRVASWVAALPVFAIVVAAAGCVPGRDNPFDPARAPKAALAVLDVTRLDGSCPADPAAVTDAAEVQVVSRGRCLALDARGTAEPGGASATFAFSVADGAAAPTLIASTGAIVSLDPPRLRAFLSSSLTFSVDVHNSIGGIGATSRSLVLTDGAPVAVPLPIRTLPIDGYPWAPGAPFDVTFDASRSHDPDGDPLLYCWTFPEVGSETCSSSPTLVHPVPPNAGAYRARLRVVDNPPGLRALSSNTVAETVVIANQNGWATGAGGQALLFDGLPPLQLPDLYDSGPAVLVPSATAPGNAGGVVALTWTAAQNDQTYYLRVGTATTTVTLGAAKLPMGVGPNVAMAWDDVHALVWTAVDGADGMSGLLRAFGVDTGTLTSVQSGSDVTFPMSNLSGSITFMRMAVDAGGSPWIVRGLDSQLYRYDTSSQTLQTMTVPGEIPVGVSPRPGTDEVWTTWTPGFSGSAAGPVVVIYKPGAAPQVIPIDDVQLGALQWIDGSRFWMSTGDHGLVIADGPTFTAAPEASLDVIDPSLPIANTMIVDPVTGQAYANADIDGFTASLDGSTYRYPADFSPAWFAAADGSVWFTSGNFQIARGRVPSEDGVDQTISANTASEFNDLSTGGLWLFAPNNYARLDEVAPNGGLLRRIEHVRKPDGSLGGFSLASTAYRIAPDQRTLWFLPFDVTTFAPLGLASLDLTTDPPQERLVLGSAEIPGLLNIGGTGPTLEPSAPVGGSAPFVWTFDQTNDSAETISTSGQITPVFTLPAAEQNSAYEVRGALSLADNRLCLTSIESLNTLHVRWIAPNGIVTTLGTETVPTGAAVYVATSANPAVCWVAWNTNGGVCPNTTSLIHVRAYSSSPTPFLSYDTAAGNAGEQVFGLRAVDNSTAWLIDGSCNGGNALQSYVLHLVRSGSTGTLTEPYDVVQPAEAFIDPAISR